MRWFLALLLFLTACNGHYAGGFARGLNSGLYPQVYQPQIYQPVYPPPISTGVSCTTWQMGMTSRTVCR